LNAFLRIVARVFVKIWGGNQQNGATSAVVAVNVDVQLHER